MEKTPKIRKEQPPSDADRSAPRKKRNQGNARRLPRRATTRFLLKSWFWIFLIVFAFLSTGYVLNSGQFMLKDIKINGCRNMDAETLQTIVRDEFLPANILRIDLQKLKRRLEQEPWVKEVRLRRVLPSHLLIEVRERVPSAILEIQGNHMIADDDGVLLDGNSLKFGRLNVPIIRGAHGAFSGNADDDIEIYRRHQEENTRRVRKGVEMFQEIAVGLPNYADRISEVDISDPENVKIMLDTDTVEIFLGDRDYLKRFERFTHQQIQTRYRELKSQGITIVTIDLRHQNIIYKQSRNTV